MTERRFFALPRYYSCISVNGGRSASSWISNLGAVKANAAFRHLIGVLSLLEIKPRLCILTAKNELP